jgi:exonuclease III
MSAHARPPSLCFATLNVNGLGTLEAKRRALCRALLDHADGVDVLFLQETHHASDEVAKQWLRDGAGAGLPWAGLSVWAAGTSASRGVAVLVRPQPLLSLRLVRADSAGRFVGALLTLAETSYLVYSVYAPCVGAEREGFFSTLRTAVAADAAAHPHAALVMGGDFNCIPTLHLDQLPSEGPLATRSRLEGFERGLLPLQEQLGLHDAFRHLHPAATAFTHVSTSGSTRSRLDRVLVHDSLLPALRAAGVSDGWPGDHRLALARFARLGAVPRGPRRWAFPSHLCSDPSYEAHARPRLEQWLAAHPPSPTFTPARRWEAFKVYARSTTQIFVLRQQQLQRVLRRRLQRATHAAAWACQQRPLDAAAASAFTAARHRQQQCLHDAAQRAAFGAGVGWEDAGEQCTAFFHRLGKDPVHDDTISELLAPADPQRGLPARAVSLHSQAGRAAAGDVLADFYDGDHPTGLFHPAATDPAAQQLLLGSIDRTLSPADREACEGDGSVSVGELELALARSGSGTAPGLDGLTYDFYRMFWPLAAQPLADAFAYAFAQGEAGRLPPSMLLGLIVLIYKGAAAGERHSPSSYRPITLLNCDYKLLAHVMCVRFGRPLRSVIDTTQTAFVQDRWIGDNVLSHLEIVDYLEDSGRPGVLTFVDLQKAYDRVSRGWVFECMRAEGFGPRAVRWVRLLLAGTQACVTYNGYFSRTFSVPSGVAQGSPLSPLLFVLAAQPLAARLRQLQRAAAFRSISLPGGEAAPPSHQHADDTALHTRTLRDLTIVWREALLPFCTASGSRVNAGKTRVLLLGSAARSLAGEAVHAGTRAVIVPRDVPVRHLGIMLAAGAAGEEARRARFAGIAAVVRRRIARWAALPLSHEGRTHVAQQCLASTFVYHAHFSSPAPDLLASLHASVMRFVGGGSTLGLPAFAVYHLPHAMGGRGVPLLPGVVRALQAGVLVRLLHPARAVWKTAMLHRLAALPSPLTGVRSLLSTLLDVSGGPGGVGRLPPRLAGYLEAFRACGPHRATPLARLPQHLHLIEPLFGSPSILSDQGVPLSPSSFPCAAAAGVAVVADLATQSSALAPPPPLAAELEALRSRLPGPLCASLQAFSSQGCGALPFEWYEWPAQGRQQHQQQLLPAAVLRVAGSGEGVEATAYAVGPDAALAELGPAPHPLPSGRPRGRPCLVAAAPIRARRQLHPALPLPDQPMPEQPPPEQPEQPGSRLYYLGAWVPGCAAPLDPATWGLAGQPLLASTCQQRAAALVQRHALADGADALRDFSLGRPLRPGVWVEADGGSALRRREERYRQEAAASAAQRGRRRRREDYEAPDPGLAAGAAWMRPSPARAAPVARAQQRREDAAAAPPPERAARRVVRRRQRQPPPWWAAFDVPSGGFPPRVAPRPRWAGAWAALRRVPAPRQHRYLAWLVQHGYLPVGARVARWSAQLGGAFCRHALCAAAQPPRLDTITHVFLECPVARQVTGWAAALWVAAVGGQPPPRVQQVWLGGDRQVWDPGPRERRDLWGILRLAVLHFLWTARCAGREGGGAPVGARAIVAQIVRHLRQRIREDAFRAFVQFERWAVSARGGPGASPLTPDGFAARWGVGGALCGERVPGASSVHVFLTLVHPVPPPPLDAYA